MLVTSIFASLPKANPLCKFSCDHYTNISLLQLLWLSPIFFFLSFEIFVRCLRCNRIQLHWVFFLSANSEQIDQVYSCSEQGEETFQCCRHICRKTMYRWNSLVNTEKTPSYLFLLGRAGAQCQPAHTYTWQGEWEGSQFLSMFRGLISLSLPLGIHCYHQHGHLLCPFLCKTRHVIYCNISQVLGKCTVRNMQSRRELSVLDVRLQIFLASPFKHRMAFVREDLKEIMETIQS